MSRRYFLLHLLCALLALSLLNACGGGTTGSDGGIVVKILGLLEDQNGAPLSGINVTVLESGASAISDADGLFSIDTTAASELELLFETAGASFRQTISGISQDAQSVEARFRINVEARSVEVLDLTVRERQQEADDPATAPTPQPDSEQAAPEIRPPPTQEGNSLLKGTLLSLAGAPVVGAQITAPGVADSATTAANGGFSLEFSPRTRLRLQISYQNLRGSVTISGLPNRPVIVNTVLRLQQPKVDAAPGDGEAPAPGPIEVEAKISSISVTDR